VPVWPPLSVSGPATPRLPPQPTAPDSAICSLTPLRGRGNSLDAGSVLASPRSSALTALLPAMYIPAPLRRAESLPVPPKGFHPAYMHCTGIVTLGNTNTVVCAHRSHVQSSGDI